MDLESECSAFEFVEDNEATQHTIQLQSIPHHVDDNKIKDNHVDDNNKIKDNHVDDPIGKEKGSCSNDNETWRLSTDQIVNSDASTADNNVKGTVEIMQPMHSSPLAAKSPGGPSPSTTKGYGLKKWRRIRRDFVKDPTATMDTSKILKRGLSASTNPSKPQHIASSEIKQNNDPPFLSLNMSKNASVAHGFVMHSPISDSRLAVGSGFAAAASDSENSEDRSSKSSTAASIPKVGYNLPAVLGYMHEKNQMLTLSGKNLSDSSQRVQQGKGHVESSKKPRGERVKINKENSSSMESDSRSSNFVFLQDPFPATSNGKQSGNSVNYDGENSDETQEDQIREEVQTAYGEENGLAADISWEAKEERGENHRHSLDQDPLVESILALQSVQEALQNELLKLGEIGKEPTSLHDDSVNSTFADQEFLETSSTDQLASENKRKSASGSLETQAFTLTHKVKYLESKLEEARAVLRAKDSRISEMETRLNGSRSLKEESGSTAELQQDKYRDTEFNLESLFLQKMEADIELLALTRAVQKLRVSVGNQITLFEEKTPSSGEQAHMLNMLGEEESKAVEELEKYCGDVLGSEEVLKMQRSVFKATSCFFTQLVLLFLVLLFVVLQLSPHSGVVVPT